MSRTGKNSFALLTLVVALASGQTSAEPSGNPDVTQMLVQGHYWVDQGRYDLARFAWEKVLRVEPDNSEANFGITDLDALHPELIDHDELLRARSLARQGQYTEALAAYRAAFRGYQPGALLSAEYLETLSGTFNGWDPAISDLRKLVERYPSSQRYQLIYNRVLSYRERGRREAILGLEALIDDETTQSNIRKQSRKDLRNALIWLSPKPADKPFFDRYLALNPDDEEVLRQRQQLDLIRGDTLKSSWALLDREEYAAAAIGFEAMLDIEGLRPLALSGLGLARLGQRRFSEAAYLLTQAKQADASLDIDTALADARFWARFHSTRHAQRHGKLNYASRQAARLLKERPDLPEAQLLLASIYLDLKQYDAAVALYERLLSNNIQNKAARAGLLKSLVYIDDGEKAQELVERYRLSRSEFENARNYRLADELRSQALRDQNIDDAIEHLKAALQRSPQHSWARLDLARLRLIQDGEKAAYTVFDAAPSSVQTDPEYRHALASFHAENGDFQKSRDVLSGIDERNQTFATRQLATEDALRLHQKKLQQLLRIGDRDSAAEKLPAPESIAAAPPNQQLIYAEMLADMGSVSEADDLARKAYASTGQDDFRLGTLYADYLIRRGAPSRAESIVTMLDKQGPLRLYEQHLLNDLRQRLLFAQSWAAVEASDYPSALAYLAEIEESMEQSEDVLMLKGFLFSQQEDWSRSLAVYERVVSKNPENLDAISAAYGLNLKLGHTQAAAELLESSLQHNPNSGLLHAYKGQIEEIQGQRLRARLSYQRALTLYEGDDTIAGTVAKLPIAAIAPLAPPGWVGETRQDLERLARDSEDWMSASLQLRSREGESGIDALDEVAIPIIGKNYLNNGQVLSVMVNPIRIDSGRINPDSQLPAWGTLPVTPQQIVNIEPTEEQGVALSLGLAADSWGFTLGSTPIGFKDNDVTGELSWRNSSLTNQLSVTLERDAIRESALSYAGHEDPATGIRWGAVLRSGARVELTWPRGNDGLIGRLAGYHYEGTEVADNNQLELLAGFYRNLIHSESPRIDAGMSFRYTQFDNDQNHFTLGHGGYFSPQQYFSISIPLTLTEQRGRVQMGLNGNFGYQHYETDNVDIFPKHDQLQAQLDNSNAFANVFEGDTVSGITYSLKVHATYTLNPVLQAGVWIASQHSDNYSETGAGVFLRYSLFDGVRSNQLFRTIDSELFEEQW